MFAPITTKLINMPEPIDEAFVTRLVDLVLAGARAGGGARAKSPVGAD
jgi:hypothetical protein